MQVRRTCPRDKLRLRPRRRPPLLFRVVANEDVGAANRIPSIPARRVFFVRVRSDHDRVAIHGKIPVRKRDVPLQKRTRLEAPVVLSGEDHDREPGGIGVGVAPDESENEVEDSVVVDVSAQEVRVIDAVELPEAVRFRSAPVGVGRRAKAGVRAQKCVDGGALLAPKGVARVRDRRGRLRNPSRIPRCRLRPLFPASRGNSGEGGADERRRESSRAWDQAARARRVAFSRRSATICQFTFCRNAVR